ncbi:MAG: hypothetical protein WBP66_14035 [Azonexus sp.]
MQPAAHDIDVALRQVGKACQRVFDNGLGDPVRYGFGAWYEKVPGKRIPEFEFDIVDASCCGMSGSFGLEAEHYEVSRQMGELALLPPVRAAASDALIVADGFSCRHQIKDRSGRDAVHVAVLLAKALG